MSFFAEKNIKVNNLLWNCNRKHKQKRAFCSASGLSGSLTIEAALVLPLFLVFVTGMLSFLMIFSVQMDIQAGLEEVSASLGRKAYAAYRAELEAPGLGQAAVSLGFFRGERKARLDRSRIAGGAAGVNLLFSSFDEETGILDAVAGYTYRIPVLPEKICGLYIEQRLRTHVWTGRELDSCGKGQETEKREKTKTVYVTEHGSVYHTSRQCAYLDLTIQETDRFSAESKRNKNGAKYYPCPLCGKTAVDTDVVYITDYGTNWHTRLGCSGLKRTVYEKDISEVGGMAPCRKCGGRH